MREDHIVMFYLDMSMLDIDSCVHINTSKDITIRLHNKSYVLYAYTANIKHVNRFISERNMDMFIRIDKYVDNIQEFKKPLIRHMCELSMNTYKSGDNSVKILTTEYERNEVVNFHEGFVCSTDEISILKLHDLIMSCKDKYIDALDTILMLPILNANIPDDLYGFGINGITTESYYLYNECDVLMLVPHCGKYMNEYMRIELQTLEIFVNIYGKLFK